jgi:hypothetical protein
MIRPPSFAVSHNPHRITMLITQGFPQEER